MSGAGDALARIADATGAGSLERHEPRPLDGVPLTATLRPADGEALGRALGALDEARLGAVVRGGGSRLGIGNPPRGAVLYLSTERLAGIDVLDAGEGVCHAGAGTPLAALRRAAEDEGWELPLDPPGEGSTLGGSIAAAATGPRALGMGLPRDVVLGLEVALASGERTHCGGRVVKNVTGYDLCKLYTGSLGTLGVIEGAWLRLRPRPQRAVVLEAPLDAAQACAVGLAAARRPTARAVAVAATRAGPSRLVVELAGAAPAVERDAGELGQRPALRESANALDEVRELQGRLPAGGGLRYRLAVLPSKLAAVFARLRDAGADLLALPGSQLLYAGFPLAEGDEDAARAAQLAVADEGEPGTLVLEEAPTWCKGRGDVFCGLAETSRGLQRALKQRFDPHGVLNPGRFAGLL